MGIALGRLHALTATLAVLLLAAPASAQDAAPADMAPQVPSLSNDQIRRLNAGEVLVDVVSGAVPIGDAIGVIDAPPDQILALLRDFDHHDDWMSDMEEAEIIGTDGEYYICRGETDTPWPMENRTYTMRSWAGPINVDGVDALIARWDYVPDSGNLVDSKGYWLLIPWGDAGNQTLLRYHLSVDLGTWLPDFLLEWSTENFLPIKITDIREHLGVGPNQ